MEKIGKYRILEKVGQGGMGVVYKALDPLIERVVAVKTVSSNLDADPELRARFFREGRSAGQLSHKNIVTIFDLGEENGTAYLAMEFLEGEDLRAKISRSEPLSLQEKIRVMIEVCEGLAHAHERNVIHRDIKPANIFVTKAGQTKILDFGLARTQASDLTTSGHALGTPNYMSPEQVRGEKVDHRTDIFSVGVLFYELLIYRKAFQGDSFASTIFKILQDDPEPIEHFDTTIPCELSAIVFKALAKDREERYQSLRELLGDLLAFSELLQTWPSASDVPDSDGTVVAPSLGQAARGTAQTKNPSVPPTSVPSGARQRTTSQPGRQRVPRALESDTRDGTHEEPTALEALPRPSAPPARYRRLATVCVSTIVILGIAWMLVHFRTWKTGAPSPASIPVSAAAQPSTVPVPSGTKPQPERQPAPSPGLQQTVSEKLAKASNRLTSRRFSEAAREASEILAMSPENAEAQSILRRARESADSTKTGLQKARFFMAAGDNRRARAVLDDVLAIAPADEEGLRLANQLNQIESRLVDQASAQLKGAKSAALDAHARELAPQSLDAAKAGETEADRLRGEGKFEQAAARYAEAADLYRRAEREAKAAEASRAEKLRQNELAHQQELQRNRSETSRQGYERERGLALQVGVADKAPGQFADAERLADGAGAKSAQGDFEGAARDYDAAIAAMAQARNAALQATQREASRASVPPAPALPATAKGSPAPEAHDSPEEVQKEIFSVPEKYRDAMEGKDLPLLKSIWPALGPQQEQAVRNQWAYTRSLRIALRNLKIKTLEKDSAVITVLLHNEQQMDNGMDKKWDQRATFGLIRRKGAWVIENATFEAVH